MKHRYMPEITISGMTLHRYNGQRTARKNRQNAGNVNVRGQ